MPTDHARHMAMLQAALPYIVPGRRKAVQILLQADSLMRTVRNDPCENCLSLEASEVTNTHSLCSSSPLGDASATENMLLCIQEYCNPGEADFIHTLLNILQASRLFQKYQEFQKNIPGNAPYNENFSGSQHQLLEFLMSNLSPEQRSTWEQVQQILSHDTTIETERSEYDSPEQLAK